MLTEAIERLERTVENMDNVYGSCADARVKFNVAAGEGTLRSVLDEMRK